MSDAQAAQPPPAPAAGQRGAGHSGGAAAAGQGRPPTESARRPPPPGPPTAAPGRTDPRPTGPRTGLGRPGSDRTGVDDVPPAPPRPDDHLRISTAERAEAQERLRHAVVRGAIELDEYGDRLASILGAETRRDLRLAVDDLAPVVDPAAAEAVHTVHRDLPLRRTVMGVLGSDEATGRWRPADTVTAVGVMGGSRIDLRRAEFDGQRLTINATAVMGGVEIIVPDGVEVTLSGAALLGGRSCKVAGPVDPAAPTVHVTGYALMGGIDVRNPSKKERRRAEREGEVPPPSAVPLRSSTFRTVARPVPAEQRRRRVSGELRGRVGRALAGLAVAAAVLVPTAWTVSSDEVVPAVFGSNTEIIRSVEDGDTVGAPVLFGSVDIAVPEGVNVERDGIVIFGSTDVSAAAASQADAEAPTVTVRTFGGFGSVDIRRVGEADG